MSQFPNPFQQSQGAHDLDYSQDGVSTSAIMRFFNAVYAWMASGLALTAVVAWWVSTQQQLMASIFKGPTLIILIVVELALVFTISAATQKINATAATALFLLYSALNGLTLSAIFVVYAHASIAAAFIVSAGMFAAVSVYGFVTKRDLTSLGSFLFMGLIGIVLASIVNIFWANSTLYWIITYAGALLFVGLTAYDTQKLKEIAVATETDPKLAARLSVNGALTLYLDFINLFLFILRIMGNRRS